MEGDNSKKKSHYKLRHHLGGIVVGVLVGWGFAWLIGASKDTLGFCVFVGFLVGEILGMVYSSVTSEDT